MKAKKIIAVDIDGVLTTTTELNDYGRVSFEKLKKEYMAVKPNKQMIADVNKAINKYHIILYTSRNDYFREVTERWLKKYGVKYHAIIYNKPYYHYIIDDRALSYIP